MCVCVYVCVRACTRNAQEFILPVTAAYHFLSTSFFPVAFVGPTDPKADQPPGSELNA